MSFSPIVICASRRTDIPGYYTSWFMECISKGSFKIHQPFTGKYRIIDVNTENIHSIVFWSKNYSPFLLAKADKILIEKGFSLYFHFTINSECCLEPGLPPLSQRLKQLEQLVSTHGPEKIVWRFDPICFYETHKGNIRNNLRDFEYIAYHAGRLGLSKCITSFFDFHPKVQKRQNFLQLNENSAVRFVVPDETKKIQIIRKMALHLKIYKMSLALCSEKELFSKLCPEPDLFAPEPSPPIPDNLVENACIDGRLLKELYSGQPNLARDKGQRIDLGCRCSYSVDIGSYQDHPCPHNCMFCYARTQKDVEMYKKLNKNKFNKY